MKQFVVWVCGFAVVTWAGYASAAFTVAEQQEIVNLHNKLRASEGASNMQMLTWNPTLALIAQNWSDFCNYAHGQGINSSSLSGIGLGQNIYASYPAPPVNVSAATMLWYNEKSDYTFTTNTCAVNKVCGHYTQVVWANTKQIGCGYTVCSKLNPLNWNNAVLVVCNYAPPGNYIGQSPYTKGTACSACPSSMPFCTDGLCSATSASSSTAGPPTSRPSSTPGSGITTITSWISQSPTPSSSCTYIPRDCNDYKLLGWTSNGVYPVWLAGNSNPIAVYCDLTTNGGGWTVFQRRRDGSENFLRNWNNYTNGFGNLNGEFWLGNEKVYRLLNVNKQYTLRIELMDFGGPANFVQYSNFRISSSADFYRLTSVGSFSGSTIYDALTYHNGSRFSTTDVDNDSGAANCASYFRGAWWYNYCYTSNLNGFYYTTPSTSAGDGVLWNGMSAYSLKFTEMKFRPN